MRSKASSVNDIYIYIYFAFRRQVSASVKSIHTGRLKVPLPNKASSFTSLSFKSRWASSHLSAEIEDDRR